MIGNLLYYTYIIIAHCTQFSVINRARVCEYFEINVFFTTNYQLWLLWKVNILALWTDYEVWLLTDSDKAIEMDVTVLVIGRADRRFRRQRREGWVKMPAAHSSSHAATVE